MDCCTPETADTNCPSCGLRGRKVGTITLSALVPGQSFDGEDWKFCRSPECSVAYYGGGPTVLVAAVSVPITQKSTRPDRPVCYCFGFSASDIKRDEQGTIQSEIKDRCRRGEDRCPQTNPQGSCCLGNVLALHKAAFDAG